MASKWKILMDLRKRKLEQVQVRSNHSLQRQHEAAKSLEQIVEYIQEYQERISAAERSTVSASDIVRARNFLNHLVQTSIEQERVLLRLTQRAQNDQKKLLECRADLKAVEKLKANEESAAAQLHAQREAKDLDEFARRQFMKVVPHM
jgi:flagellar export protein FliJ